MFIGISLHRLSAIARLGSSPDSPKIPCVLILHPVLLCNAASIEMEFADRVSCRETAVPAAAWSQNPKSTEDRTAYQEKHGFHPYPEKFLYG